MTEMEFADVLGDVLQNAEELEGEDGERPRVRTYAEVGMLTNNAGLVIRLADGSEYQLTLVRSR